MHGGHSGEENDDMGRRRLEEVIALGSHHFERACDHPFVELFGCDTVAYTRHVGPLRKQNVDGEGMF